MDSLKMKEEKIMPLVLELNLLLADLQVYKTKLKNFQWNALGRGSLELQNKFQRLYASCSSYSDKTARRIIVLGYHPISRLKDYLELSTLEESLPKLPVTSMVKKITEDISHLLKDIRRSLKLALSLDNYGTVDLLTYLTANLEEDLSGLQSLQKEEGTYLNTIHNKI
ncbi:MAG: DNA starvation/stationary phase protection protein [Aquimarina sp.]|nr:DNA starvation/stationary phase protection protein [Aquimarina sp.]